MSIKNIFVVLALGIMLSAGNIAYAADLGGDGVYDFGNSSSWYLEPEQNSSSWYLEPEYNSSSWYLEPEYNSSSWYLEPEYNSSSWYLEPSYGYDYGCYDCGSYGSYGGGGYYGGGSSYRPSTGGGYYMTYPTVTQGARPSGGSGGGSQSQTQSQVSNNTNTNTNVNINNNTAVAVAQVQIGSQVAQTPTYSNAPYCSINQAQSYGSYGVNPVYLSWTSSNAQQAYLSTYGSVGVNGSQTVYPGGTTTYTLTVYGYNGQQASCQTTVYANNYTYTPPTPYVSLTQIPYTGFDFGPVGNAMYWAGLAVFALGAAYFVVFYIPMVFTGRNAYANSFKKSVFTPVVAPKAPILAEKEAMKAKVQPIVEALRKAGTTDAMAIVQVKGSMPKIVVARS